jgi:general transcription factor 3C polypeptide 3 (transcription factor C subunit 4)
VIDARGRRSSRHGKQGAVVSHPSVQGVSLFEETPSTRSTKGYRSSKSSRPVARELEVEKEKEVLKGYQRVMDLTPAMKTGNEVAVKEWLLEAEKLIETFRETRRLFLSTRVSHLPVVSDRRTYAGSVRWISRDVQNQTQHRRERGRYGVTVTDRDG